MRQHNIWCVYVRSVWRGMPDCSQNVYQNVGHFKSASFCLLVCTHYEHKFLALAAMKL